MLPKLDYWKEYDELWKRKKDTSKGLEAYDLEQQVNVQRDMADVITTAKKLQRFLSITLTFNKKFLQAVCLRPWM